MAAALRACCGPRAAAHLARLTGSGELYNLLRCIESLTGRPLGEPLWRGLDPDLCGFDPAAAGGRTAGRPAALGPELPLHLEAALYLLAERLAWSASAGPGAAEDLRGSLDATLDLAWQTLGEALDGPLPTGLWAAPRTGRVDEDWCRADSARLYCAYLAGLEQLEQAHPERPAKWVRLTDLHAHLKAALEDGSGAGADPGRSVRGHFYTKFQDMAQVLRTLERAPATALLEQFLRHDWSRLPLSFKDLLRTCCLEPGGEVRSALAAAPTAAAVLAIAGRYAQRPDLVVAVLAAPALWHRRRSLPAPNLAAIGRHLRRLHRRLGPAPDGLASAPPDALPPLVPPSGSQPAGAALAADLIADPDFIDRLEAVLAQGEAARRWVRERVAGMGVIDLEGLALGPHLPAACIMDEIRLRAGPGAGLAAPAAAAVAPPS